MGIFIGNWALGIGNLKNRDPYNLNRSDVGGFSLIELLVITAIIATFSVVLILNFRSSPTGQTARNQTASVVLSDIRRAQSAAIAGSRYSDNLVCGFGVHFLNSVSYSIYAKKPPASDLCSAVSTRNYQADDWVVETRTLINSNMEFRSAFSDIFFEMPDPKTYIDNSFSLTGLPATLTIQVKGQQNCGQQSCTQINVYSSGEIDLN